MRLIIVIAFLCIGIVSVAFSNEIIIDNSSVVYETIHKSKVAEESSVKVNLHGIERGEITEADIIVGSPEDNKDENLIIADEYIEEVEASFSIEKSKIKSTAINNISTVVIENN